MDHPVSDWISFFKTNSGSHINGHQTYELIIKLHPGQKVVVASGFSESDDVKATAKLGAGGFIKPLLDGATWSYNK